MGNWVVVFIFKERDLLYRVWFFLVCVIGFLNVVIGLWVIWLFVVVRLVIIVFVENVFEGLSVY